MPENIMKTLWDESDDLHDETMSTNSVLSDDYTSNDIQDLQETIENENIEDGIESDSTTPDRPFSERYAARPSLSQRVL